MENQSSQYATEYEILDLVKLKLYQRLHGLAPVLGAVKFQIEETKQLVQKNLDPKELEQKSDAEGWESEKKVCVGFRTDGHAFYLSQLRLQSDFLQSSDFLSQELLHMLSHCLLGHPFEAWRVEQEERKGWEAACDEKAWELTEELWGKPIPEKPPVDDHSVWGRKPDEREKAFWQGQGEKLLRSGNPRGKRKAGTAKRHRTRQLVPAAGQRGDYRSILRGLSSYREDSRLNLDEFQYSWYTYGLEMYGNMPLIEPLETSEVRKIEEFVIVIDTSMSCKEGLVKRFLEETYDVLSQTENFFRRMRIHILQCDERVQSDVLIESQEALKEYMEHFTILGGGGTDFRPAFTYVEEQLAKKKFWRLRGLLYFTDGYGVFPVKMPPYETAFIFVQNHYRDVDVPAWAIKLILQESDLENR